MTVITLPAAAQECEKFRFDRVERATRITGAGLDMILRPGEKAVLQFRDGRWKKAPACSDE